MILKHNKTNFLALLIIIVGTLIIFRGALIGNYISNANYIYTYEPWIHYRTEDVGKTNNIMSDMVDGMGSNISQINQLRSGHIPLWDNSDKLGTLGITNIQNGFTNPIKLVPWYIFGPGLGWTIEIILKFILGGFFFYLFLNRLKVSPLISLIATLGFMFGSSNIGAHQAGFSTVPLLSSILFYAGIRLVQSNKWIDVTWVIISGYLVLMAGFVSVSFYFAFWFTIFIIALILSTSTPKLSLITKFSFAFIAITGISSFSLLPTYQFYTKALNLAYRANYGARQLNINSSINLLMANIFGHPLTEAARWKFGSYINTAIFVGFISAASIIPGSLLKLIYKRDFYIIFFTLVCLFLFANIYNTPFEKIELITKQLPIFSHNSPTYQKTVLQFFLAILGGLSLEYIIQLNWKKHWRQAIFISISYITTIVLVSKIFKSIYHSIGESVYLTQYYRQTMILAVLAITCVISIGIAPHIKTKYNKIQQYIPYLTRLSYAALILIMLLQAGINAAGWIVYTKPKFWYPEIPITQYLKTNIDSNRILSLDKTAIPATLAAYDIPTAAGRGSVPEYMLATIRTIDDDIYKTHPTQSFFDRQETNFEAQALDLLNVKYWITSKNFKPDQVVLPNDNHIISFKEGNIIERDHPINPYFITNQATLTDSPEQLAKTLSNPNFDSTKQTLITRPKDQINMPTIANTNIYDYQVTQNNDSGNKIEFKLTVNQPSYVTISKAYYPGWQGYANHKSLRIFPSYGFLLGTIITEPGTYDVKLIFKPQTLVYGSIISLTSIILVSITLTWLHKHETC